jgi:UDP-N-acetylmuramoyl-L-alanyl-D-glutamate--2,6-diaminopimelate ligase
MRLEALISGLAVEVVRGGGAGAGGGAAGAAAGGAVEIKGLTEDSRAVGPGWLFVARRGEKSDGRKFVAQAVERGAAAVLSDDAGLAVPGGAVGLVVRGEDRGESGGVEGVSAVIAERFYGEPTRRLAVCGVTGTNGKTTTTFLVHQIMNGAGRRCGLVGTVQIDDGAGVVPAVLTTPPAMELSRTFARMVEHGCVAAAIEASSHALSQRRVAAVKFRAAGFTNLTQDHLDYHGTMEAYAAAKAELFAMLEPGGIAVMNAQDPWTPRMLRDVRAGVEVWGCAVRRVGGGRGRAGARSLRGRRGGGRCTRWGRGGWSWRWRGPRGLGRGVCGCRCLVSTTR